MRRTVTLETAKKLKEERFRQDTELCYPNSFEKIVRLSVAVTFKEGYIAAPTIGELLEELPFTVNGDKLRLIRGETRVWHVWYGNPEGAFMDINLCEGLAKMWLWLKQEELLT